MAEVDIASFCSEVKSCSKLQKELATELRDFAENLKSKQRKVDIAKLTSSNAGLVGGVLAIAGMALAPFTAGVSLGLTIAGGVVGGGSAVSGISSMIVEDRITKNAEKHLSQKLHDYAEISKDIKAKLNKLFKILQEAERIFLQNYIENIMDIDIDEVDSRASRLLAYVCKGANVFQSINVVTKSIIKAVKISKASKRAVDVVGGITAGAEMSSRVASAGKSVGTAADAGTEVTSAAGKAATAGKAAATGVKVAGWVLAVAGVAVDLGSIIYYSHKIHKNDPSKYVDNILDVANCLEGKETRKKLS